MFIWVVIIIAGISVLLSIRSLKNELGKKELSHTKKELQRGRVVFKSHSSS